MGSEMCIRDRDSSDVDYLELDLFWTCSLSVVSISFIRPSIAVAGFRVNLGEGVPFPALIRVAIASRRSCQVIVSLSPKQV